MSMELKRGREWEEVGSRPAWETWQSQEGGGKGLPEGNGGRDGVDKALRRKGRQG